jgi:putative colanic acid biosynthesis glycosyltransferase WcaI
MRVLVLSQWYPPEPQSVVSDLAETLAQQGHDVEVLTGFPNWPSGRLYPGYRLRLLRRETWNGVPIARVPLFPYHGRSPIGRVLNLVSFCLAAIVIGPWVMRRPDVIHAIQPPTTCFPAWALSRLWRVPFTYEVQDLWPDTLRATGMVAGGGALGLVDRYCRWAYRKAAAIRVISKGFREELLSRQVPDGKIAVIPNWVDIDRYKPVPAPPRGDDRVFRVVYAGNMGLAQGLDNVLQAAAQLPALAPVRFVLIGDGVEASVLRAKAAEMGLANVEFVSHRPAEEMPAILSAADVLLLHLKNDPLFRVTIPHKLLTYLAVGKPIIACAAGEAAEVLAEADAGIACAPGDPAALAAAVLHMTRLPDATRAEMGRAGRAFACARFERGAVVAHIGRMLLGAAGGAAAA